MMLIYAALLSIPDEVIEAAECDGITGLSQFWKIKLPLILPTLGIISILTFVGNFNAFDLIYMAQGALAGPNFSTDMLGTFLYRTFFGFQLQIGDPNMGAAIATVMFLIILAASASTCSSSRRACAATSSEGAMSQSPPPDRSPHHRRPLRSCWPTRSIALFPVIAGRHELVQDRGRHLRAAADAAACRRPST